MEPDNRIWANPDLLKLWLWCLVKANYTGKRWVSFKSGKGRIDIEIEKGQFVYGRHSASEDLGINPSTLRDRMKKLADLGFISINSASQYSLITICNYEYYQDRGDLGSTINPEAIQQANHTPTDTTKKLKKLEKLKKKKPIVPQGEFEKFYEAYPKKKNRADAEKAWRQLFHLSTSEYYIGPLTGGLLEGILSAIKNQATEKAWKIKAEVFCPVWPYPGTWLRSERWEDVVEEEPVEINEFV